jgi:hypothetical protein
MWFIGQKIVCINARFPQRILEWASEIDLPREGHTYTIRSMAHGTSIYNGEPRFGFRLKELQGGRCGFFAERFAPLLNLLDQACHADTSKLTSPVCNARTP